MSARIEKILSAAERGEDLLADERGMFWRGFESRYSVRPQRYSIYVPESYDSKKPEELIISLHGGSSNHNVWLAINLGNRISVEDYWASNRKRFRPARRPDAIVAAPDGLGQVRWRWMGEQDVLDVIEDIKRNYNIDEDKIFLTGLSNGGIGSYTIGLKHAWKFAAVLPLAGVTDWIRHHEAVGRLRPCERTVLETESAIAYAENAANTNLRFYHGVKDPGFAVDQARRLARKLEKLGLPFRYHELGNRGHDLTNVLWNKLQIMDFVERYSRVRSPAEVRLVTASPRANRQAWLVLDERVDHLAMARVVARVADGNTLVVETENAERFTLLLSDAPVSYPLSVIVDGEVAYIGGQPAGGRLTFSVALAPVGRDAPLWNIWDGSAPEPGTRKTDTGPVGPFGDVMYEPQVHVYGTQVAGDVEELKRAAELGARAWVPALAYSDVRHPVVPDSELTDEMMRSRAVVLYGNAKTNSVLAKIGDRLPIRVGEDYIGLRGEQLRGRGVGVRFVCPNPLAPNQYLMVQAGVDADAVVAGGKLPIYIGDYLVYDHRTTRIKAFMILAGRDEIETGFFTEDWKLPSEPPPDR
ncbi:MAG: prolyl oligopeptidase family serine peptidase [Deltaproteobacteria bacterium]|nr:prolyl oligopeptidase family serine peptidase [Deltaproteobacteria bacterium]